MHTRKKNHSFDQMTSYLSTIITNNESTYSRHIVAREILPVRKNRAHVIVSSILDIRK